jgi:hypothetical protein
MHLGYLGRAQRHTDAFAVYRWLLTHLPPGLSGADRASDLMQECLTALEALVDGYATLCQQTAALQAVWQAIEGHRQWRLPLDDDAASPPDTTPLPDCMRDLRQDCAMLADDIHRIMDVLSGCVTPPAPPHE